MANRATHEIFSTRMWDILPSALHGYKQKIDENIAGRFPFIKDGKTEGQPYLLSAKNNYNDRTYVGDTGSRDLDSDDEVICVIHIDGAILRNGGACSYGSKEHRDIMRRAADDNHTIGVVIVCDSPGGSSYAKYDYEDGINYVRSKGIPIIGLVDGFCCSAGYTPIAMCDEAYAVGLHDQIGCIGTMAAFFTNKDGDVNSVTQQRYIEVYSDDSPYKNKEVRDASEGDYTELKKEVNDLCKDYRDMVALYRPKSTEEQRKGAIYNASEVFGTLIDGQLTMKGCIDRILELSTAKKAKGKPTGTASKEKSTKVEQGSPEPTDNSNPKKNPINKKTMDSNKYKKTMEAAGVHALVVDEENGAYFSPQMIESVEVFAENAGKNAAALISKTQEATQLNAIIAQMKSDHATALSDLATAHATELGNLKTEHATALSGLSDSLKVANDLIAAKDAEIIELSEGTPNPPLPKDASPKGNQAGGVQEPEFKVETISKPGMTAAQKNKAWKERMEIINAQRYS